VGWWWCRECSKGMIRTHNEDQLVISRHQSPRLHLCSVFLFDDIFPVANPCALAEEWPVHAFFWRRLKQPPDVFMDCFHKCVQMSDLSARCVFQLLCTTLAIVPVTIQIPLVPDPSESSHCCCHFCFLRHAVICLSSRGNIGDACICWWLGSVQINPGLGQG